MMLKKSLLGIVTALVAMLVTFFVWSHYRDHNKQKPEPITTTLRSFSPQPEPEITEIKRPARSFTSERRKPIEIDFKEVEVDLLKYHCNEERLAQMAAKDKEFPKRHDSDGKNGLREYNTSQGSFKIVSCFGRQSTNPEAYNYGGWRHDMVQLPTGKWVPGYSAPFTPETVLELDGTIYIVTNKNVLQWIGDEKIKIVASSEDSSATFESSEKLGKKRGGLIADRYIEVHTSNDSHFGGFLEYRGKGEWRFHPYIGRHGHWIESVDEHPGQLILTLYHYGSSPAPKIAFDTLEGHFIEMP